MDKLKILVAEDAPDILELNCLMLASAGHETLRATNGRDAWEIFNNHRSEIQLVLLDLVMPEMDGREVAEHIRQVDQEIKILFVSGYVPDAASDALKEPLLRKPYRRDDLLECVDKLLKNEPCCQGLISSPAR